MVYCGISSEGKHGLALQKKWLSDMEYIYVLNNNSTEIEDHDNDVRVKQSL